MTLQDLDTALKEQLPGLVFELAAPKGMERFVAWHSYGRSSVFADNRNALEAPRVQIDIVTNVHDDTIADDVCAALWLLGLPYSVESEGYDPDYNANRTILQLVVY